MDRWAPTAANRPKRRPAAREEVLPEEEVQGHTGRLGFSWKCELLCSIKYIFVQLDIGNNTFRSSWINTFLIVCVFKQTFKNLLLDMMNNNQLKLIQNSQRGPNSRRHLVVLLFPSHLLCNNQRFLLLSPEQRNRNRASPQPWSTEPSWSHFNSCSAENTQIPSFLTPKNVSSSELYNSLFTGCFTTFKNRVEMFTLPESR